MRREAGWQEVWPALRWLGLNPTTIQSVCFWETKHQGSPYVWVCVTRGTAEVSGGNLRLLKAHWSLSSCVDPCVMTHVRSSHFKHWALSVPIVWKDGAGTCTAVLPADLEAPVHGHPMNWLQTQYWIHSRPVAVSSWADLRSRITSWKLQESSGFWSSIQFRQQEIGKIQRHEESDPKPGLSQDSNPTCSKGQS